MKNSVLLAIATVSLIVFLVIWESSPELFIRKTTTVLDESPKADSYMRKTFTQKFAENGALSFTLDAVSGEYFNRGDRLELQQPEVIAFTEQGSKQPWHLNAEKAIVFNATNRVVMRGKVHAWQIIDQGKNQLLTPRLVYSPDADTIETQSRVKMTSPTSVTTAKGLTANLAEQTYHLLSQVKTTHKAP